MSHDTSWRPITLSIGANSSLFSLNCATIEDSNTTNRSPRDVTSIRGLSQRQRRTLTMVNDTTPLKCCTKCGNEYPATTEHFYRKQGGRLYAHCKICHMAMTVPNARQWQINNPERSREIARQWAQRNPDILQENSRKWQSANREKTREMSRHRRKYNPEAVRNASRRWAINHRDASRIQAQKTRARKRLLPSTFTAKQWQMCLEYFNCTCAYCGAQQDFWHVLEQEHVIPVTAGGGYIAENIIPACKSCNTSKNNASAADWLASRYPAKKAKAILSRIEAYFEYVKSLAVRDE